MKFVCISDVHIKEPDDKAAQLFLNFLKSNETKTSETIYLLGDIFDLIVGGKSQYLEKYHNIFDALANLIKDGKKVVFFEGNHDFHFKKLLRQICKKWSLEEDSLLYQLEPKIIEINGEQTLLAHGDEIEIENPTYQKYRRIIRSFPINFLANYVVPHFIVNQIGVNASKKSRERNMERYGNDNNEKVREKYRRVFKNAQKEYGVRNLICGHSHCRDEFQDSGLYLNNGFFPLTQSFTHFDGKELYLKKLSL